jgi:hypothetical protein
MCQEEKMKNVVVMMALTLAGTLAQADGFICTSESGLNIKVYNHTMAEEGTRTASVMVISDSNVGMGNKTIARFTDVNGNLSSGGAFYDANVDLRYSDSSRKGELIAGTKLGYVDHIYLHVDFNYSEPVVAGAELPARLQVLKRDGTVIEETVSCLRYLKN